MGKSTLAVRQLLIWYMMKSHNLYSQFKSHIDEKNKFRCCVVSSYFVYKGISRSIWKSRCDETI